MTPTEALKVQVYDLLIELSTHQQAMARLQQQIEALRQQIASAGA